MDAEKILSDLLEETFRQGYQKGVADAQNAVALLNTSRGVVLTDENASTFGEKLNDRVADLPALTTRTINGLGRENIRTVGELARQSEETILSIRNMHKSILDEVAKALMPYGLMLPKRRP